MALEALVMASVDSVKKDGFSSRTDLAFATEAMKLLFGVKEGASRAALGLL